MKQTKIRAKIFRRGRLAGIVREGFPGKLTPKRSLKKELGINWL